MRRCLRREAAGWRRAAGSAHTRRNLKFFFFSNFFGRRRALLVCLFARVRCVRAARARASLLPRVLPLSFAQMCDAVKGDGTKCDKPVKDGGRCGIHKRKNAVCADASFDLTAGDLARCIEELKQALLPFVSSARGDDEVRFCHPGTGAEVREGEKAAKRYEADMLREFGFLPKDAVALRCVLLALEAVIVSLALHPADDPGPARDAQGQVPWYNAPAAAKGAAAAGGKALSGLDERVEDGTFLYRLLKHVNINEISKPAICQTIDAVSLFLAGRSAVAAVVGAAAPGGGGGGGARGAYALEALKNILDHLFCEDDPGAVELTAARDYCCVVFNPAVGGRGGRGAPAHAKLSGAQATRCGRTLSYRHL